MIPAKKIITLSTLLLFVSCSSYVNNMYKDLENQDRYNADVDTHQMDDTFDQYRKTKRRTSQEYNRPSANRLITTNTQKFVEPQVKRQYKDEKVALRRLTAQDLTDNAGDGSIWSVDEPNSFLFANNKNKTAGDIVQINIGTKLKDEISMELKRAFPDNPYENKGKESDKKDNSGNADRKLASEGNTGATSESKEKISSVVVEEINREHLLIKGRKNVLFKNKKRLVEVQALVSRKDIDSDDSVNSDNILETNVAVVQ